MIYKQVSSVGLKDHNFLTFVLPFALKRSHAYNTYRNTSGTFQSNEVCLHEFEITIHTTREKALLLFKVIRVSSAILSVYWRKQHRWTRGLEPVLLDCFPASRFLQYTDDNKSYRVPTPWNTLNFWSRFRVSFVLVARKTFLILFY